MALIPMPSKVYFEKADLQLLRSGVTLRSKYTGKRQTVTHPFALWVFQGDVIPMEGADAGEWRAFLTQLEGQANTFQLKVPGASRPDAPAGVTAKAATAVSARAKSFVASGANNTKLLSKGDYFTINGELKVALADATTNGVGEATLTFEPGLRTALAGSEAIELRDPYCVMSSTADEAAAWSLSRPTRHSIKLNAMEAF